MAVVLASCDSDAQSTPLMYAANAYRTSVSGAQDTIRFGDTIHVGDTVRVPLFLLGQYNMLTSFQLSVEKSAFDYQLYCDSLNATFLAPDSKLQEGYMHFLENCFSLSLTLHYVAKQKGDYQFQMTLSSTASEKYSPNHGVVTQPVR